MQFLFYNSISIFRNKTFPVVVFSDVTIALIDSNGTVQHQEHQ